jgi:hypothetical protein
MRFRKLRSTRPQDKLKHQRRLERASEFWNLRRNMAPAHWNLVTRIQANSDAGEPFRSGTNAAAAIRQPPGQ